VIEPLLTPAQKTAVEHRQSVPGVRSPEACSTLERLRGGAAWNTTLVLELLDKEHDLWAWHGSVARSRNSGRPCVVEKWKPKWIQEAHHRLDQLLQGVGDREVPLTNLLPSGVLPGHLFAVHRLLLVGPIEARAFLSSHREAGL